MSPFAGTVSRRHRAKWRFDSDEWKAERYKAERQCVMHTSTNRRCVKAFSHRGPHDTRPAARGLAR